MNDGVSNMTLPNILIPSDRKQCVLCHKFLYFHQYILRCNNCKDIYHGSCLKLDNSTIFILQQFLWFCKICYYDNIEYYKCVTCSTNIDIFNEKIAQCKQCFKMLHKSCIKSNICSSCLPLPLLDLNTATASTLQYIETDFYSEQPFFAPFEYFYNEMIDFIPDVETLSENLQDCSKILRQCVYYKLDDFKKKIHDNGLSLLSLNIDGFRSNFDCFLMHHEHFKADGYFLCETNVTEHESQPFYIPGYNKFVLNRLLKEDGKLKHKGSGLVTFLRDKFKNINQKLELCYSTVDFESLCVEITVKSEKLLVINCYRSPSGNFDSFIDIFGSVLSKLNTFKGHKSYIFGDFNVNLYNSSSSVVRRYLDCMFSNNFLPIISRATHFGGLNGTCIDHILTNNLSNIICNGLIRCNISRHLPTFVVLDYNLDPNETGRNRNKVNINDFLLQGFLNDFKLLKFDFGSDSAENIYSFFDKSFKTLYDKWFIKIHKSSGNNSLLRSDWISIGVAKSSDTKNRLYDIWVMNKTRVNWNKYVDYKRVFDAIRSKEKFDYFDKCLKANQYDLKKTWKLINGLLGRKRSNRLLAFPNQDAAHNFNSYFVNIANDLLLKTYGETANADLTDFNKYMPERNINELSDIEFTSEEIKNIISKLNNSKGTYYSPRVLKLLSTTLSPLLADIFNKCANEGYFPKELKAAKIIPLYKNKGSISDISNYRPISMLPVFAKIFEKLIHKNVSDFFNKHNIFCNNQFGFRSKHSTFHALVSAVENLHDAIDNKNFTLGIFIDFSKAFDTVRHNILLEKLKNYGIRGNVIKLLNSYLSDRFQYVSYGGFESCLLKITCGIPQGSVLGPLLFIIFINDLANVCELAKFILFADDLNLFLQSKDRNLLYKNANEVLSKIHDYCCLNRLVINFDKCCYMEFGSSTVPKNKKFIGILNNQFNQVDKCKFLGVIINSNLTWNDHITNVITQVSKSCGSLYSISSIVPAKVLRQVYISLVQPYLMYCIPLWGAVFHHPLLQKLFVLQKKCIRIVSRKTMKIDHKFQHTKPMFFRLKLLTLFNLFTYFTGCIAMGLLKERIPVDVYHRFSISSRSCRLLYPKFSMSKTKNNNFVFNASKILNYLLEHDVPYHILSISIFKKRFKNHLLHIQNLGLNGDNGWLPCNHDIFSNVSIS